MPLEAWVQLAVAQTVIGARDGRGAGVLDIVAATEDYRAEANILPWGEAACILWALAAPTASSTIRPNDHPAEASGEAVCGTLATNSGLKSPLMLLR